MESRIHWNQPGVDTQGTIPICQICELKLGDSVGGQSIRVLKCSAWECVLISFSLINSAKRPRRMRSEGKSGLSHSCSVHVLTTYYEQVLFQGETYRQKDHNPCLRPGEPGKDTDGDSFSGK